MGSLELDDPLELAVDALGSPDERHPDINASVTSVWHLDGRAEVGVTADHAGIVALHAYVPPGSPTRVRAFGGVEIGTSTPTQVLAAWGVPPHRRPCGDDFVLLFVECAWPWPVVVKFDQEGTGVDWDEPVTSVLLAYADEAPGTAGCPAP